MELILTLILTAQTVVPGPSGVDLERLIDNSIQLPGTADEILFDGDIPVPCGDGVLFYAVENNLVGRRGAYFVSSTELKVIVDEATPAPDSNETFESTQRMRCVDGDFVFLGSAGSSGGVYRWKPGGSIELILEYGMQVQGREAEAFVEVSGNSVGLATRGRMALPNPRQALIVKYNDEEPFIVADSSRILPGQIQPVTIYGLPMLDGADLVFLARTSGNVGLYRWSQGRGITVIADPQTAVPVAVGTFGAIGLTALMSKGPVFSATYPGGEGIFIETNGVISPLVVTGDVTEAGETITAAYFPSGGGDLLSFLAKTEENSVFPSVYVRTAGGKLQRILGTGDIIEGHRVSLVNSRADSTSVAMRINTAESPPTNVIYRATFPAGPADIPTLPSVGLVVLALGLMLVGCSILGGRRTTNRC